jgi:hypothetical protein
MLLAASYPFLDVLWTMFIFFLWVIWFWLLFTVFVDVFRRHDIGGWKKAAWLVFVIILPFLGVFIYAKAQQAQFDTYVRETAGGSAAEIADAKKLLDEGTITQAEFDAIKQKALA